MKKGLVGILLIVILVLLMAVPIAYQVGVEVSELRPPVDRFTIAFSSDGEILVFDTATGNAKTIRPGLLPKPAIEAPASPGPPTQEF